MKYNRVHIEAIGYELPPVVVSTAELESRLAPVYQALKMAPGQLELLTGINERRWWEPGYPLSHGAAAAAKKALAAADLTAEDIDVLIYAGVCREQFEPATACAVAHELEDQPGRRIYDLVERLPRRAQRHRRHRQPHRTRARPRPGWSSPPRRPARSTRTSSTGWCAPKSVELFRESRGDAHRRVRGGRGAGDGEELSREKRRQADRRRDAERPAAPRPVPVGPAVAPAGRSSGVLGTTLAPMQKVLGTRPARSCSRASTSACGT